MQGEITIQCCGQRDKCNPRMSQQDVSDVEQEKASILDNTAFSPNSVSLSILK